MIRILHLSDLHFGTEAPGIVPKLMVAVRELAPGLVVISGDFTQVASREEYEKAREFLHQLGAPVFCVPGNHDVPRYNLLERFLWPYKKYKKIIADDCNPVLEDPQFLMAGLNTARRMLPHWNWAHGAVSRAQRRKLEDVFAGARNKYRICVMHHPVHKAEKTPLKVVVFGARKTMQTIHDLEVDLVLTGHVHSASITTVEKTIFASASTAISHRLRAQQNGFNVIDLHEEHFEISHYIYNGENFIPSGTASHAKNAYKNA